VVPVASFHRHQVGLAAARGAQAAAATRALRLPHDYLTERLTGAGVTDRGDASGTAWWSTATEGYAAAVLEHPGIPARSPDAAPGAGPGRTGRGGDAGGGGVPGTACRHPRGPGDRRQRRRGGGLGLEPGIPVISLGTSGTAFMCSSTRAVDPSGAVAGFADAPAIPPLACTLNCTLAVDRIASWLGLDREAAAERTAVVVAALHGRGAHPETSPMRPPPSPACATPPNRERSSWPPTRERRSRCSRPSMRSTPTAPASTPPPPSS